MAKHGGRRPGAGRPGAGRSETIKLRVTPAERRAWEQQAERAGVTMSEWIRERCNR